MNAEYPPTTASTLDTDHKRGCAGREYTCTCGYDDAKDAEIGRLRAALTEIARLGVDMRADFSRSAMQAKVAREALS